MGFGVSLALAPAAPANPRTPTYAFDLSTCTPTNNCVQGADGSRTYTITTATVPVGSANIEIATWDAAPVSGDFNSANELSDGEATASISQRTRV